MIKQIVFFILSIVTIFLQAEAASPSLVKNYGQLVDSVRNNQPPSGYVNLAKCKLNNNSHNLPVDQRVYRVSFDDNYIFDSAIPELYTSQDILFKDINKSENTKVLKARPATIILAVKPNISYVIFKIVRQHQEAVALQIYHCDWKKGVYLWRKK